MGYVGMGSVFLMCFKKASKLSPLELFASELSAGSLSNLKSRHTPAEHRENTSGVATFINLQVLQLPIFIIGWNKPVHYIGKLYVCWVFSVDRRVWMLALLDTANCLMRMKFIEYRIDLCFISVPSEKPLPTKHHSILKSHVHLEEFHAAHSSRSPVSCSSRRRHPFPPDRAGVSHH
jgi:hypothetical protein